MELKKNYVTIFPQYFNDKIVAIRHKLDSCAPSATIFDSFEGVVLDTFCAVSASEIRKLILDSNSKSCELDPMPTNLFKVCIDEILPHVTNIINVSLSTGSVPNCYKKALVKPLLKKMNLDENNYNNFRPVSNLSFVSKLLERVVLKQFLKHLEKNNLVENFQSAYIIKKIHSTETAIEKISSNILTEFIR